MSADVRYVRTDEFTYEVKDRAGCWLGEVWHDLTAREWYAYARDDRRVQRVRFAGIARTRREATDLILNAAPAIPVGCMQHRVEGCPS